MSIWPFQVRIEMRRHHGCRQEDQGACLQTCIGQRLGTLELCLLIWVSGHFITPVQVNLHATSQRSTHLHRNTTHDARRTTHDACAETHECLESRMRDGCGLLGLEELDASASALRAGSTSGL